MSEWAAGVRQKLVGGLYFTKKSRAEALEHGLYFDNFKHPLKTSTFKYIFWLNGFFFVSDDRGLLIHEVYTLVNDTNVAS